MMSEGDTRRSILTQILRNGPVSATDISDTLGLSAAGVRRHLDNIVAEGLAETVEAPRSTAAGSRGRGRPARLFRLTDAGRGQFGHDYDSLALLALRALRETGGDAAVARFADQRMEELFSGVDPEADEPVDEQARNIAGALTARGYAATVDHAGGGVGGALCGRCTGRTGHVHHLVCVSSIPGPSTGIGYLPEKQAVHSPSAGWRVASIIPSREM